MHQENNENINNDDTIDFDLLLWFIENVTTIDNKKLYNFDD